MKKNKTYTLDLTEEEMKMHLVRRAVADLVQVRIQVQAGKPFFEVSEAEAKVMKILPLFTPLVEYKNKKYPNEIGKYRGKVVVLK